MEIPGITFPILGDFTWNFLPYFTVFGWKIYWYGVIIAVGFLLAVVYAVKHASEFGLTEDDVIDTLIWAVPLGILGARLYYVIFYRDSSGLNPYFDGVGDLRDIIAVWEGGLAIYGGVIGGVIGLVIATRMKKISSRAMLDVISFGLLIGQAIGRWGNFTNREAHGTETMAPWRMGLVYSYKTFYYHPTFLYESLWNILGFLLLHFVVKKKRKFDGQLFLFYLAWYGLGRLFIEGLRTDSLFVGTSNLRVSQLLAGLTCLMSLGLMLYVLVFRRPEPEQLWRNRDRAGAAEPEKAVPAQTPEELMTEERFDEELSDAFRILTGKSAGANAAEEPEEHGDDPAEAEKAEEAAAEEDGEAAEMRETIASVFESAEDPGGETEEPGVPAPDQSEDEEEAPAAETGSVDHGEAAEETMAPEAAETPSEDI